MSNIFNLRGSKIANASEPNEDVINFLEMLLENARMGKIRGIAVITVSDLDFVGTLWAGDADSRMLLSGTSILNYRLATYLIEQDE